MCDGGGCAEAADARALVGERAAAGHAQGSRNIIADARARASARRGAPRARVTVRDELLAGGRLLLPGWRARETVAAASAATRMASPRQTRLAAVGCGLLAHKRGGLQR